MNRRSIPSGALLAVIAAGTAFAPCADAQVQAQVNYRIQHNFRIFPGGNLLPSVQARWYDHVWVREFNKAMFQVNPAAQPMWWGRFSNDWLVFPNFVLNWGPPILPANRGTAVFGPAGGMVVQTATVPPPVSQAFARSTIAVNPYAPGGPVTGFTRADGFAIAVAGPVGFVSRAYSFAMASCEVRGRAWFFGQIIWGPMISSTVSGGALAQAVVLPQRPSDPIYVRIVRPDGTEAFQDTLLSIEYQLFRDGELTWEDGMLRLTSLTGAVPPDSELMVKTNPRWIMNPSGLHLVVRGGVVVVSEDYGVFDGFLPPEGAMMPHEIPLPPEIPLEYMLPTQFGDDITFDMGGGSDMKPPCPPDFNRDGVLDFFDYLDFVAAWDAEDPSADYNFDEVIDFFDYLDFVADFDRGCESQ